jgi:spore coat polysaccharide biosynthesis protein SpsF
MTTAVVVQARTGSTRLPNKVLLPLAGEPLLVRMVERLRAATTPFELVVATTTDPSDDPIVRLCETRGIRVFRGHPTDLLDRHLGAAESVGADVVVKIPSDCPLIDPACVDRVLSFFHETRGQYDFVSNLHPPTWPDGNDVEVMPIELVRVAHREASKPLEREHTTPFLWDRPDRFRVGNVAWETGRDLSMTHRFTIDYAEDYAFLEAVYAALYRPYDPVFSLDRVLSLLDRQPEIFALNQRWAGVNWYRNHLTELTTIDASRTRQG